MSFNYPRAMYDLYKMIRSAYWNHDKMRKYQEKKLRHLVKYSYDNVKFYHDRFKELNMRPEDISGLEDLGKLPVVKKDDIRRNPDAFLSREFRKSELRRRSTSGSTGKPLYLSATKKEDEFRKLKQLRNVISLGQRPWDRWVVVASPHHFGATTKLASVLNLYVPVPVSVFNNVEAQLSIIGKLKPDVLDGYSSSILLLAKEVQRTGTKTMSPKFVIGGAELIDDASRRYVESVFNVPFYDHYICIEFGCLSWQCPERTGYHMDVDSVVLQFVDGTEEVAVGETGEIICTSLFNYAMPLIRYAIGDVGASSNEECPCGRTLPLMKMIKGRRDSLLLLPDGLVLSPRAFTVAFAMFKYYAQVDQFRIIQKQVDLFQIIIKMKENRIDQDMVRQELTEHLRKAIFRGSDLVTFDVKFVDDIPVDKSGKLMIVVSELPLKAFSEFEKP